MAAFTAEDYRERSSVHLCRWGKGSLLGHCATDSITFYRHRQRNKLGISALLVDDELNVIEITDGIRLSDKEATFEQVILAALVRAGSKLQNIHC